MIQATNVETGEVVMLQDVGANLHLWMQIFSPLEWALEIIQP